MHGCQSNSLASHLNHLTGDLLLLRRTGVVNVRLGDQISALEKNTPIFKSIRLCNGQSNVSNTVPSASRAECSCQVPALGIALYDGHIMPFLQGRCGVKMYLGGLLLETYRLHLFESHSAAHMLPLLSDYRWHYKTGPTCTIDPVALISKKQTQVVGPQVVAGKKC